MDCKSARLLLEFARPGGGEVEAADAEALQQHLAECPECAALAHEERRADEHLGRAMRGVPVPDGLRERLLKRLSVERDAWYRRWLVRWAAAAAAAVLAVWVGYQLFNQRPAVTGDTVRALANGQGFPISKDQVVAGLRELGAPVSLPSRFNYALLDSYGLKTFQGRPVPYLLFLSPGERGRPPALAHVYILSNRQFDLDQSMRNIGALSPGSRYQVDVSFNPDMDALYLVLYTGNLVEDFYRKGGTG